MSAVGERLADIRARIGASARAAGRVPDEVTLVAVSKLQSAEAIREAYAAGQRHFGESYAQELREKAAGLADLPEIRWHFIGHLQRNKVKAAAPWVALLETVDTPALAAEAGRQAGRLGREIPCLVQVNVGREPQKSGCPEEEAGALAAAVERTPGLRLLGLMTIPPFDLEPAETRVHFAALRRLRDALGGAARLPYLSMGMSHDFEAAIAEGATIVRVGTAVFGPRG